MGETTIHTGPITWQGRILFSQNELQCPETERIALKPEFVRLLTDLRVVGYGTPMTATSCCRSWKYNQSIDGHIRSLHVYDYTRNDEYVPSHLQPGGCAIDISCTDGSDRAELIEAALERGFSVGIYSDFLHLDLRTSLGLPRAVFWGKY